MALKALSATSRMEDSAVDVRTLRQEVESLRTLHREAAWDAQIKSWGTGWIIPDVPWFCEFQRWMRFRKTFGYDIQVHASWIMKTFRCVMARCRILQECGHCPVVCFEKGRVVVKLFDDVTFDDVVYDSQVHGPMPVI
jgi:hypothetical protein